MCMAVLRGLCRDAWGPASGAETAQDGAEREGKVFSPQGLGMSPMGRKDAN